MDTISLMLLALIAGIVGAITSDVSRWIRRRWRQRKEKRDG